MTNDQRPKGDFVKYFSTNSSGKLQIKFALRENFSLISDLNQIFAAELKLKAIKRLILFTQPLSNILIRSS